MIRPTQFFLIVLTVFGLSDRTRVEDDPAPQAAALIGPQEADAWKKMGSYLRTLTGFLVSSEKPTGEMLLSVHKLQAAGKAAIVAEPRRPSPDNGRGDRAGLMVSVPALP